MWDIAMAILCVLISETLMSPVHISLAGVSSEECLVYCVSSIVCSIMFCI